MLSLYQDCFLVTLIFELSLWGCITVNILLRDLAVETLTDRRLQFFFFCSESITFVVKV